MVPPDLPWSPSSSCKSIEDPSSDLTAPSAHTSPSYFLGYDLALTPLVVAYPVEIWPYQLRARGLAVSQITSLGAIFFNTFVNPIALEAIAWKYYFVFVVILIAMLVTVWFTYPETRGRTLENIAWLFDGEHANVGIVTAENTLKSANLHVEDTAEEAHVDEKKA